MSAIEPLAKRRKTVQLFDEIHVPPPIIGQVLEYLDVPSLVQLGDCNSNWKKQVYVDNPNLWKEIEFMSTTGNLCGENFEQALLHSQARKMSYFQLAALLRRCNAKERCQVLKLTGCIQLTGHGLQPLRGSCVLREIDLRLRGSKRGSLYGREIDVDKVLPILSSMPPIRTDLVASPPESLGLLLVKFDRNIVYGNYYEKYDLQVEVWVVTYEEKLVEAAKTHRPRCSGCQQDLVGFLDPEHLPFQIPTSYCEFCKMMSCSEEVTPRCTLVPECEDCNIRSCQPRQKQAERECPNNVMIFHCNGCDGGSCEDCLDDGNDGEFCAADNCPGNGWFCKKNGCSQVLRSCKNKCIHKKGFELTFCPNCIDSHEKNCTFQSDDGCGMP